MTTKTMTLCAAGLLAVFGLSQSVSAGGFHFSSNPYGYGYGSPWRGQPSRTAYRGWGGQPRHGHYDYHDTSHLDYVPGGLQWHGNHMDYVPGGYYLHQEGHLDYHHGHHVHH